MGEGIEPQRRQLAIREKEPEVLAASAYPPPGSTAIEVLYNQLDPVLLVLGRLCGGRGSACSWPSVLCASPCSGRRSRSWRRLRS